MRGILSEGYIYKEVKTLHSDKAGAGLVVYYILLVSSNGSVVITHRTKMNVLT